MINVGGTSREAGLVRTLVVSSGGLLTTQHGSPAFLSLCVCVCLCVCVLLTCIQLFATPWTVACQTPLSTGFSRQEYLSVYTGVGSLSLLQGTFPTQGSNTGLLHCRQILYHLSRQGSPPELIFFTISTKEGQMTLRQELPNLVAAKQLAYQGPQSPWFCLSTIF